MENKEYSLRERKFAKTKIAITRAFVEQFKSKRFDDISIKIVCREAEVAEGTFFNYFPGKINVIIYYLALTSLKMIWEAKASVSNDRYLSQIDSIFTQLSRELGRNNNLYYQVISVLIAQSQRPEKIAVSNLEKKLAFPNCSGIEEVNIMTLDEWFKECVIKAIKNGELPKKTNVDDVAVSLITILCGTLLATRFHDADSCGYHYKRQLKDLWQAAVAK